MAPKRGTVTDRSSQRSQSTLAPSTIAGGSQAPTSVASRSSLRRNPPRNQPQASIATLEPPSTSAPRQVSFHFQRPAPGKVPNPSPKTGQKRKISHTDPDVESAAAKRARWSLPSPKDASGRGIRPLPGHGTKIRTAQDLPAKDVNESLARELAQNEITAVPIEDFVRHAFPAKYALISKDHSDDDVWAIQDYKASWDSYWEARTTKSLSTNAQAHRFLKIVRLIASSTGACMSALVGRSLRRYPEDVKSQTPNACITSSHYKVDEDNPGPLDQVPWEDVLIPIYFSGTATQERNKAARKNGMPKPAPPAEAAPSVLSGVETLASYAVKILSASCLRRHTFALLVDYRGVILCYFDRGGAISSTLLDISKQQGAVTLFRLLGTLLGVDREGWGFIPAFVKQGLYWPSSKCQVELKLDRPTYLTTKHGSSKTYTHRVSQLERLTSSTHLEFVGRGTQVYLLPDDGRVLKLSWQPVGRPSEADFLERARRAGVVGLPHVRAHGVLSSWLDSEGIRKKLQDLEATRDVPLRAQRELRALVLDEGYTPLDLFPISKHPLQFLQVIKGLLDCHRALAARAYILHRDINPSNLCYTGDPTDASDMSRAWRSPRLAENAAAAKEAVTPSVEAHLIDLDFAALWWDFNDPDQMPRAHIKRIEDSGPSVELASAGLDPSDMVYTLDLRTVAIEMLLNEHRANLLPSNLLSNLPSERQQHLYRHDLESFFWSIWWLLAGASTAKGETTFREGIVEWASTRADTNAHVKSGFLLTENPYMIPKIAAELWEEANVRSIMIRFLADITAMFANGTRSLPTCSPSDIPTACGHITFSNFSSYIDRTIEELAAVFD